MMSEDQGFFLTCIACITWWHNGPKYLKIQVSVSWLKALYRLINPWHSCTARIMPSLCLSVCLLTTIFVVQAATWLMGNMNSFSLISAQRIIWAKYSYQCLRLFLSYRLQCGLWVISTALALQVLEELNGLTIATNGYTAAKN